MEKENMIIILLVVVIMIAAFQTMQIISLGASSTGAATATAANGAPDMTGWTDNEKMNYEMHGIIPARAGGGSASGSSGTGMVGGC